MKLGSYLRHMLSRKCMVKNRYRIVLKVAKNSYFCTFQKALKKPKNGKSLEPFQKSKTSKNVVFSKLLILPYFQFSPKAYWNVSVLIKNKVSNFSLIQSSVPKIAWSQSDRPTFFLDSGDFKASICREISAT